MLGPLDRRDLRTPYASAHRSERQQNLVSGQVSLAAVGRRPPAVLPVTADKRFEHVFAV